MQVVVYLALGLLAVVALFQLALASGLPAGAMAWGGARTGVLPTGFRVASAIAGLVVYPLIAWYLLTASGVIGAHDGSSLGVWALAAFFGVGAVANAASRSKPERWWAPVSAAIAVCCVVIAVGL